MQNDFFERYKHYSTIELLKIVKRAEDYQDAAVETAKAILIERTVSEEEIQEVEWFYEKKEEQKQLKKKSIDFIKDKINQFTQPVSIPSETISVSKWLNVLLFIIFIQYLFSFYQTSRFFYKFLIYDDYRFDVSYIVLFASLAYIPVILYLLFIRNKWGWILLFADNLFVTFTKIATIFLYFKYRDLYNTGLYPLLYPLVIKFVFVFPFFQRLSIIFF